jgi:hypothetical protein
MDADRYTGPWNTPTANPILVVGNTTDPGTPYVNSLLMARELNRARLLTVDGYGHTASLNKHLRRHLRVRLSHRRRAPAAGHDLPAGPAAVLLTFLLMLPI